MTWPIHPAAELFPLLAGDELAELAADIKAKGLNNPVWLVDDAEHGTMLLDGRNRLAACERAGVPVRTQKYAGDDPIGFSISQNLITRHLTVGQRAFVALQAVPLYEAESARRKAAAMAARERDERGKVTVPMGADLHPLESESIVVERKSKRATDKAASKSGTSGRAVAQAKRITEQAPDLAAKVTSGALALDRADRIIRDREAEKRKVEQAKEEAAAVGDVTTVDIRHGDFREVLADLHDIDAVITDPPYPHEFIPLLGDLAAWADKVLAPNGLLALLMGQSHLPEVYRLLDGHRPYRWTACYLTAGAGYVSHPRRVHSNWKPLIVYGGGPRFGDVFRTAGGDAGAKDSHRWGQDYSAFHDIIERLTTRGQTVADPFMGAGTTLLAAHALGRHAIGSDIEAASVATARQRLA